MEQFYNIFFSQITGSRRPVNISAHEVSELLFHPANFDNDDGIETNGGLPDIKQVSFDFIYIFPIQ